MRIKTSFDGEWDFCKKQPSGPHDHQRTHSGQTIYCVKMFIKEQYWVERSWKIISNTVPSAPNWFYTRQTGPTRTKRVLSAPNGSPMHQTGHTRALEPSYEGVARYCNWRAMPSAATGWISAIERKIELCANTYFWGVLRDETVPNFTVPLRTW